MLALAAKEEALALAECELSENSHPGVEPFFEEVHPGFKLSNLRTALEKGATFTESRIGSLYGARYYDPVLARFIQPDDSSSDNYMYALNNPMTYVDPTGHFAQSFGGVMMDMYRPGGFSAGTDTSRPPSALMMPPGAATAFPSGVNPGLMGPAVYQGMTFTRSRVTTIQNSTLPAGTVIDNTTRTTGFVSGNEIFAELVYPRYGSFFSAQDIAGMTWDRSRFWDPEVTTESGTRIEGTRPPDWLMEIGIALMHQGFGGGVNDTFNSAFGAPAFGLGTTDINGRQYTGHALNQMEARRIPPSVVDNTISTGKATPGNRPGTTAYHDPVNNVTVVTDSQSGRVVTVRKGPP